MVNRSNSPIEDAFRIDPAELLEDCPFQWKHLDDGKEEEEENEDENVNRVGLSRIGKNLGGLSRSKGRTLHGQASLSDNALGMRRSKGHKNLPYIARNSPYPLEVAASLPSMAAIAQFVATDPLFHHIADKGAVIERLGKVAAQKGCSQIVENLSAILNKGPISELEPFYADPNLTDFLVLALIHKQIEKNQLVTVCKNLAMRKRYQSPEVRALKVPMPIEHNLENEESKELLRKCLPGDLIDLDDFFADVDLLNMSERQFYLMPVYTNPTKDYQELYPILQTALQTNDSAPLHQHLIKMLEGSNPARPTIMDAVYDGIAFSPFKEIEIEGQKYRIHASAKMLETIYSQLQNLIQPEYRFGMGPTLADNPKQGIRDVSIPSPYATLPMTADGLFAPDDEFINHDLHYHCFLCGMIPKEHQLLFVAMHHFLLELAKTSPIPRDLLSLADRFVDMDSILYNYFSSDEQRVEAFWNTIEFYHSTHRVRSLGSGYSAILQNQDGLSQEALNEKTAGFVAEWVENTRSHSLSPELITAYTTLFKTFFIENKDDLARNAGVRGTALQALLDKRAKEGITGLLETIFSHLNKE